MKRPGKREVLSVSEISGKILSTLERAFPDVWVKGEIGDMTMHSSGHWYFTMKDDKANLRAVMFKNSNRLVRFRPEEGMEVLVRGRISAYTARGIYQLYADWMEPLGVGALYAEFERLKKRLEQEGLFDIERKRAIPSPLKRVAIITSAAGAALQDMLRILRERDPGIEVLIVPSRVQGEGAADELALAMEIANMPEVAKPKGGRPIEAIIIGRGGGSIEDLWAFNEEVLARAIYKSKLPVISAVGHETDFSISDFVSDLRAATPTAAAEIVAAGRAERLQRLSHARTRMVAAMERMIEDAVYDLDNLSRTLRGPARELADYTIRVDELHSRMQRAMKKGLADRQSRLAATARALRSQDPRRRYEMQEQRLSALSGRLIAGARSRVDTAGHRLANADARLETLSPRATLSRGFAIALDKGGNALKNADRVKTGDDLELVLHKGKLDTKVTKVRENE